jgi:hypothetical protein
MPSPSLSFVVLLYCTVRCSPCIVVLLERGSVSQQP